MKVFVQVDNQNRIKCYIRAPSLVEARRLHNRLAPILRRRLDAPDDQILDDWTNVTDFVRIRETTPQESDAYWVR